MRDHKEIETFSCILFVNWVSLLYPNLLYSKDLCVKSESEFVTVILDGFSKKRRTTEKYFHFPNPLIFKFPEKLQAQEKSIITLTAEIKRTISDNKNFQIT